MILYQIIYNINLWPIKFSRRYQLDLIIFLDFILKMYYVGNLSRYLLDGFPLTHGVNLTCVSSRLAALAWSSGFNTLLTTFAAMLE